MRMYSLTSKFYNYCFKTINEISGSSIMNDNILYFDSLILKSLRLRWAEKVNVNVYHLEYITISFYYVYRWEILSSVRMFVNS